MIKQREECRAKLLQYANKKRLTGKLNDITIQSGQKFFSANRMVLSCYSKYFESMCSSFVGKHQDVVIQDIDGDTVRDLIEFMYTGKINISMSNVMTVLSAAHILEMEAVKIFCFEFFETALTNGSCLEFFKASVLYKNASNFYNIICFISENFDQIIKEDIFKNLSSDELSLLFSNLNRSKIQEISLYEAILNWVLYDDCRKSVFSSLFLNLYFERFPSEFIEDVIAEEPLVKQSKDCLNRLLLHFVDNSKKRRVKAGSTKILCIGGLESSSVLEIYNITESSPSNYPNLPCKLSRHCSLRHNTFLYCIGGAINSDPHKISNKVYRLNLKRTPLKWEEMAPMMEKRCDFGAAVYEGCIVVAGGFNGDSRTNTVEAYEGRTNQWRKVSSLKHRRDEFALVAVGSGSGGLFALGGWDGKQNKSVELLETLDMTWKAVSSMNTARRCFTAVYCDGIIFAIGGWPAKALETVEKYDCAQNKWNYVSRMNTGRWRHASCVFQGKIFVVGGENAGKAERSIECYDPAHDQWSITDKAHHNYFDHNIVSV